MLVTSETCVSCPPGSMDTERPIEQELNLSGA